MAYSCASALENATIFCCRLYVFLTCSLKATMPPLVLRAVRTHAAKSESVYVVTNSSASCPRNLMINPGVQIKYLQILFKSCQCFFIGALIALAASFAESLKSIYLRKNN